MKALKLLKLEFLKSQILLSLWASRMVKIYSNISFDKREGLWTLCRFINLKMQTLLICSHALLAKTIQIHLLTKVRAWTIRKLRKWSQFVPITFLNQHCLQIDDLIEKLIPCSLQGGPFGGPACPPVLYMRKMKVFETSIF